MTTIIGNSTDENIKGGGGADVLSGGAGDDFLQGKAGGDIIDGGQGNDQIQGNEGDDHIIGGEGDDYIHGGIGTDRAYYTGSVKDYSYSRDGENFYLNHTGGTQLDGDDRLISIEFLVFADAIIDLNQNNAPIAFNDTASTDEDNSVSGNVLTNDFDWEGDAMTATPGTFVGVYGTLVLSGNGSYTYTPHGSSQSLAQGQVVQDVFTYTVSDGSLSDTGTLTVNISGVNDAPVANSDIASTGENNVVLVNVLANDTDVDNGAVLTVVSASAPSGQGSASVVGNQVQFDPGTDFDYLDTGETAQVVVSYTIQDEHGATSSSTVTITVNGANDAPVAIDDTDSTDENNAVSGNVLANDTDVDGESLVVANPGTYVGANGTLVLNSDGSYTYTPNAGTQGLDDGESVSDTFSYTASDGDASDTATLTVTVNGVNDAPVANDDSNATGEDSAGVSGNVLANDTDVDGETLTVASPGTYVGTYGTLVIAADGSYTYTPGAAAQGLDTGETAQDVFAYSATDGDASDSANLTITVSGANDAPVAVDDTNATDENTPVSGNVLANDTDVDVENLTVVNAGTFIGALGTLVLNADGSYTYTPGAGAALLDNGETADDVFFYIASDGTASDTATLTITVSGLSGVPDAVDDTATTNEDSPVSGNVLTNDTDPESDTLTVSNPGTYVGTYGTLDLNSDGSYTYTPNATADTLAVGETAQDVFSYTATDGGASDTANLTVTITGTNDTPVIDAGNTDASGSITELPDGDPGEGTTVHTDSGTIAFDDPDLSDVHSATFTPQGVGYLGSFTLDPVDQSGNSVGWDFTVSDAALEGLAEGQIRIQTYEVEIDDGNGGTATQTVTITITGAGVGVGPQSVWYIDNTAVGSANLGTQADPYTSIAAFNAAQGTLGGPQVGHTIHLLAGTGTGIYAEADGINLLNDQILVGDANGSVRPTIEATAGDGINVAQNNNVSGIDIGNTSGADIADSGGSVGNLTISDVASSGTGRIIDVDQGGTLNVTLTSAESLASSGGAIDLAGVGGSFTVTGATTITGVHSGGGVDVTGSSVDVSLAGGGTVSTADTTAINFVGNSGSLSLDGGFAIVTTSGAGINASGGGTVTVTGTGNTVVSTTGTAVNISGTSIGSAGVTFESVSANGGSYGIRLANTGTDGGLTITGTGSVDASGGTIQNIGIRGIELIGTVNVSLSNIALLNANTVNGVSTDLVVSGSNAAIYLSSVAGVTLDNIDIAGTADSGIVGINVSDFVMDDSTITLAGNGLNESGMEFTNLSGDSSISNTDISFSRTNSIDIVNTDVSLNLVLDNVTIRDTQTTSSGGPTNTQGDGGLQFRSFSTAAGAPVTNIDIIDSDFLRLRTQGIQIVANNDSIVSADITNNVIDSQLGIGTGIDLNSTGTAEFSFNVIGNTVQSRSGNAINVTATGGSDIEGRINQNVVTANTSGIGIRILAENNGSTAIVEARDNTVTMGTGNASSAIDVLSRLGDARVDITLDNNTLDSNPTALADINITAGASSVGETASVYANIINNDVLAGGPTNVLRLRVADADATAVSLPQIFLEGFVEGGAGVDDDAVATWNANGNTPTTTAATVNVTLTAGATAPSAGVAQVPDNAQPLMAHGLADQWLSFDLLGQAELDAIVDAAIQHWVDAGADAGQIAAMEATRFSVADLAGLDLGLATGNGVLIDDDGAGYGWSFGDGSAGGMDLLTVVLHELGHIAGFGDHYSANGAGDIMYGYLDAGVSRLPDLTFGHEGDLAMSGGGAWTNGAPDAFWTPADAFLGGAAPAVPQGGEAGFIFGGGGEPLDLPVWP